MGDVCVCIISTVEKMIWRNNFKRGGLEVVKDEESFSRLGQHVKMHQSDVEN